MPRFRNVSAGERNVRVSERMEMTCVKSLRSMAVRARSSAGSSAVAWTACALPVIASSKRRIAGSAGAILFIRHTGWQNYKAFVCAQAENRPPSNINVSMKRFCNSVLGSLTLHLFQTFSILLDMPNPPGRRGFSILEMLIAVSVLLILGAITIPSMVLVISNARLQGGGTSLAGLLQSCQMLAVKQNETITLRFTVLGNGPVAYLKPAADAS